MNRIPPKSHYVQTIEQHKEIAQADRNHVVEWLAEQADVLTEHGMNYSLGDSHVEVKYGGLEIASASFNFDARGTARLINGVRHLLNIKEASRDVPPDSDAAHLFEGVVLQAIDDFYEHRSSIKGMGF